MGYLKREGRNSVFGIFNDQQSLDHAISILKSQNFRNSDISVLMQSKNGRDFAIKKQTKAPEGATTGAATGAVAGGIFGWLVGAGALAIPGLGPFIAAGPIMAAIAGAGLGGTVGGVAGGLIGLGIPEFEAQRYEGYVKEGGMLISIHVDDNKWETKAREILEENGAINIATTSEKKPDDDIRYDRTAKKDEWSEKRNNSHGSE
jgi:uncharacterized protein YcfJ